MAAFSDLLFYAAWWMLAVVAAGGIFALIAGLRRLDKKLRLLGIALVLIAAILATLRLSFPTDREKMEKRSRQLVQAVDRQDWTALRGLLDANTVVGFKSRIIAAGRDAIVASVKQNTDRYTLRSVWVIGIESEQTETLITVPLVVYSTQDFTQGRPVTSTWQLDYQQSGDQWILEKITLLRIGNDADTYPF
ncbi:MAG: hypothetical protein ABSB33_11875 [Tepidisphaeraceae bacterium]|jgi:hypothetical protein